MQETRHERPCTLRSHLYEMSKIGEFIETGLPHRDSRLMVARGWGRDANGYRVSFWGEENVLELGTCDGC